MSRSFPPRGSGLGKLWLLPPLLAVVSAEPAFSAAPLDRTAQARDAQPQVLEAGVQPDMAALEPIGAVSIVHPVGPPPNAKSPLGIHVDWINDWSGEWPFVDAFKTSRPWIPQCTDPPPTCDTFYWDTGEADLIDVDANGWVRSLPTDGDGVVFRSVGTILFTALDGHYPAGEYVVLYDGEGTILYHDGFLNADASSPGRDVLNVDPEAGNVYMEIVETDPNETGNYIRNIRFIMPGLELVHETQQFHPDYLAFFSRFSMIRFSDWMQVQETQLSDWEDRARPEHARYSELIGAPLEVMIDLCNELHADPWFTLPHMATDDFVRNFAELTLARLDPGLSVYVEYSNEVWNPVFMQGDWVEDRGMEKWPQASPYTARLNWYGMRTAEVCDIFDEVWGDEGDRVVCVMAGQSGFPWTLEQAPDCPLWDDGPCYPNRVDAVAISSYLGYYISTLEHEEEVETWTSDPDGGLEKLFTELEFGGVLSGGPPGGALANARELMSVCLPEASSRGLPLVAYEGGQGLVGERGPETHPLVTELFNQANRDPRMGHLYDLFLEDWRALGGLRFNHYTSCRKHSVWGSYGALEFLDEGSGPKYDALLEFIDENPCWWQNCPQLP